MATIEQSSSQPSQLIKSLGMGSGVDVQALAKALAEAENSSRIESVTARKEAVETRISGYAVVSLFISDIKDSFDQLKNVSNLYASAASSSAAAQVSASVTGTPEPGDYSVEVQQLATPKTIMSNSFAADDTELNGGAGFTISLTIDSGDAQTIAISAGEDTPTGIVTAINAAGLGVTASLINKSASGNDWYVLLRGENGASNTFSVSADSSVDTGFADSANILTIAQNSLIKVNGLENISRSSNVIDDVISGLTLDISAITASEVSISVTQDYEPLSTALDQLVDNYNQFNLVMNALIATPEDDSDTYTGSLISDRQMVFTLKNKMRELFTQTSSTASGDFSSLRDLGLTFSLDGTAELDYSVLSTTIAAVSTMLSGGTDDASDYSDDLGLAQDISIELATILSSEGILSQREVAANSRVSDYDVELALLATRLDVTYQRYLRQFALMESFVQKSNGIGDYLKGQFEAMENMYRN